MRVGFLILNLDVRGSARRVVELANRLLLRGHEVAVYTLDGIGCKWLPLVAEVKPQEDVLTDDLDALIYFNEPSHLALMRESPARRKLTYMLGIDQRMSDWLAAMLGADIPPCGSRMRTIYHSVREFEVIANCEALSAWFRKVDIPCKTVLGGVDFDTFRPCRKKTAFSIVSGGARRAIEGTQEVLLVRDQVVTVEPRASFVMYAGHGLSQDDLAGLYSSGDVFLDAQWYGGWNNPVAEAMACRTAVICTDIHGNEELAIDGETALIVPVGAVEQMTESVLRLLTDGPLRARLASAGHQHVQQFTWDRATDQLEAALFPVEKTSRGDDDSQETNGQG